jgi:hypothetical protein
MDNVQNCDSYVNIRECTCIVRRTWTKERRVLQGRMYIKGSSVLLRTKQKRLEAKQTRGNGARACQFCGI